LTSNNVPLAGRRAIDGISFEERGSRNYFWSSTESGTGAYGRHMDWDDTRTDRSTWDKSFGFSVRCLKD